MKTGAKISFGSDNHAGVHPKVMQMIQEANEGYVPAYGGDPWTARAHSVLRTHFGANSDPWIVFNGTGANVLSIGAALRPYEAVICAEGAHIAEDEVGAPEAVTGSKLIGIQTPDNKLTPQLIEPKLVWKGDSNRVQPKLISITQSTEYGTLYQLDELKELVKFAKKHDLLLHMDGARISNAAAALNVEFGQMCEGFDCVSLGGTKNGLMGAEAVVFLNPKIAEGFVYRRKQTTQLVSKMRFLAAQLIALYEGDLWRTNATHANELAKVFRDRLKALPGVSITQKVEANAIFALMKTSQIKIAQGISTFYVWKEDVTQSGSAEVRFMTSFQTKQDEIDYFFSELAKRST